MSKQRVLLKCDDRIANHKSLLPDELLSCGVIVVDDFFNFFKVDIAALESRIHDVLHLLRLDYDPTDFENYFVYFINRYDIYYGALGYVRAQFE